MLKSIHTGLPVTVGQHVFVNVHSLDITEYQILAINKAKRLIWSNVVMSYRAQLVSHHEWRKAEDLDLTWV